MHRTQLLLEAWQYDALRTRAERAGISLSELVRRVLSEYLAPEDDIAQSPLLAMEGIGTENASARQHDDPLYAEPVRRKSAKKRG